MSSGATLTDPVCGMTVAPALAQAYVGIAMGTGTDVVMQSAGVALVLSVGSVSVIANSLRLRRVKV